MDTITWDAEYTDKYVVELGVPDSVRIIRNYFDTLEEAENRARWRMSSPNSKYWAVIIPPANPKKR